MVDASRLRRTVVHTVNLAGSNEFSVHVLGRRDHPEIVAVFTSADKKTNRANAIAEARQLAFELRCKVAMNHGIRRERWREFLQK